MKRGRAGTMTHDYKRHGTIDLFAAMNVGTGEVHTHLRKGHAGADVLAFFKQIDATVAQGLSVHVILDNLSAHKAPEVRQWLAHKSRRRWHLHFIPTSSSWLNLVERWFRDLTDKQIRRGVFKSVADLIAAIQAYIQCHNQNPKPFVWTADADLILGKVGRLCERISDSGHCEAFAQARRLSHFFSPLEEDLRFLASSSPPP